MNSSSGRKVQTLPLMRARTNEYKSKLHGIYKYRIGHSHTHHCPEQLISSNMSISREHGFPKLDYDLCTDVELQTFADNRAPRTGEQPPRSRGECYSLLRALDANPTFRFKDLPPELRLEIYDELLKYDPSSPGKSLTPLILATCKTINKDARKILYSCFKTTTLIRITCRKAQDGKRAKENSISIAFGDEAEIDLGYNPGLLEQLEMWPKSVSRNVIVFLKIADSADLNIAFNLFGDTGNLSVQHVALKTLSHSVFILATLLSGPGDRRVDFRIRDDSKSLRSHELLKVVGPLADIGLGLTTSWRGVPDEVVSQHKSQASASDHDSTILAIWNRHFERASAMVQTVVDSKLPERGVRIIRLQMNAMYQECVHSEREHADSSSFLRGLEHGIDEAVRMMADPKWSGLEDEAKNVLDQRERARVLSELPFREA